MRFRLNARLDWLSKPEFIIGQHSDRYSPNSLSEVVGHRPGSHGSG